MERDVTHLEVIAIYKDLHAIRKEHHRPIHLEYNPTPQSDLSPSQTVSRSNRNYLASKRNLTDDRRYENSIKKTYQSRAK